MQKRALPEPIAELVEHLATLPNVVAVTLRGSRRTGTQLVDGDWDLGLYYHDSFDSELLAHLDGAIAPPRDGGPLPNSGARLLVEGQTVDIHFRDLDEVHGWIREAESGNFQIDQAPGHVAGVPTYTLAAEVALNQVLAGSLEDIGAYPDRLAESGVAHWRHRVKSSLDLADHQAATGNLTGVKGHLARAYVEAAHARLCAARRWTLNERDILERAELTHLNQILSTLNSDPVTLMQRVMQARTLLLD